MAEVFVSFATEDLSIAREVVGWLRADGHDVFLDRDATTGIRAGEQWRQRLYDELRRVDAVISVVTPASAGSAWCTAELGIADALGCLLIPLVAADGARHPLLGHRQHVDYQSDPPTARTRVLDALRHLDGGPATRRWRDGANPFPGLEPFSCSSAPVYFGRTAEIRELTNRLRAARTRPGEILVVVGPSGCGKSSLLNAGVLPLLAHDAEWVTTPPWTPLHRRAGARNCARSS